MAARDEGDTLRVNDPLAEFIRSQGGLANQTKSHDEFLAAYEEHVKNNRGGDDDTHSEANTEASTSNATVAVASRPIPKRTEGPALSTTIEAVSSSSSISNSKGGSAVGDEIEDVSSSATTSPNKIGNTTNIKSIVLKFTTLSDACTEAPSFSVNTTGATIGRSETNEVCVPSDTHLVPVGHASIEYSNGSFFLLDGGFDYPASIRVGASCSMKSTWRLEIDARFSAGSSIFWCRGVNEAGELLVDIIDGPLKGESRVINKQGASIGRASENTLAVPDRELSRKHSRIEFDAKANKFVLVDLGSTNGTYMQLVGPYGGRYRMTLNDHILVGRTGFSINRFDYGLSEEMGHRQTMEDACAIVQHLSIAPLNVPRYSPQSFFGVYDGHGGAEASAYLSQYLHVNVSDALLSIHQDLCALDASGADQGKVDDLVVKVLKTSFLKTDEDFISTASQAHAQHGSTATTGLLLGQRLYCANVGDSRTLLCRCVIFASIELVVIFRTSNLPTPPSCTHDATETFNRGPCRRTTSRTAQTRRSASATPGASSSTTASWASWQCPAPLGTARLSSASPLLSLSRRA